MYFVKRDILILIKYNNLKIYMIYTILVDLVDAWQWSTLKRLLEANWCLIFTGELSGLQGGAQGAAGADGTAGCGRLFGLWTFGWGEQDSWRESKIGLKERRKECFKAPV